MKKNETSEEHITPRTESADRVGRRKFLKRSGGATAATVLAWHSIQGQAFANEESDSVSASVGVCQLRTRDKKDDGGWAVPAGANKSKHTMNGHTVAVLINHVPNYGFAAGHCVEWEYTWWSVATEVWPVGGAPVDGLQEFLGFKAFIPEDECKVSTVACPGNIYHAISGFAIPYGGGVFGELHLIVTVEEIGDDVIHLKVQGKVHDTVTGAVLSKSPVLQRKVTWVKCYCPEAGEEKGDPPVGGVIDWNDTEEDYELEEPDLPTPPPPEIA